MAFCCNYAVHIMKLTSGIQENDFLSIVIIFNMYREQEQIQILDLGHRGKANRTKLNLSKENIDTGFNWTRIHNQLDHKRTLKRVYQKV